MEINEQLIRAVTEAVARQLYAKGAQDGQNSGNGQGWTVQGEIQEGPEPGQKHEQSAAQNTGGSSGEGMDAAPGQSGRRTSGQVPGTEPGRRIPGEGMDAGAGQSSSQSLSGKTRMRPKHSYEGTVRAEQGTDPKEIVIGVGAAFQTEIRATIGGISLDDVLRNVKAGIEEEGMTSRVVKVLDTSDVCFMALQSAKLSGSGIGIGIQSKGTTVIHQKDLYPLTNLELFPQAPLMDLETYRRIGQNAAKYVKGEKVTPIECTNDPMVRAKYQVKAALMHIIETEQLDPDKGMIVWEGVQ